MKKAKTQQTEEAFGALLDAIDRYMNDLRGELPARQVDGAGVLANHVKFQWQKALSAHREATAAADAYKIAQSEADAALAEFCKILDRDFAGMSTVSNRGK